MLLMTVELKSEHILQVVPISVVIYEILRLFDMQITRYTTSDVALHNEF